MQTTIKLMKHYVTDGTIKARVFYSRTTLTDGSKCVTIYAKDYTRELGRIFKDCPNYKNDTDTMTDYFDQGCVRIFPADPLFSAAQARAVA